MLPVLQHSLTTPPPGTQPLRAAEPSVPLCDVPWQSCGQRVLGGGTRVPRAEQSGGATLEQAGEGEGTLILAYKFGGASWDSDGLYFLAPSGHWAWLPLPCGQWPVLPVSGPQGSPQCHGKALALTVTPESTLRRVRQDWGDILNLLYILPPKPPSLF